MQVRAINRIRAGHCAVRLRTYIHGRFQHVEAPGKTASYAIFSLLFSCTLAASALAGTIPKIVAREDPDKIPFHVQLERFAIPLKALPPDSSVINYPVSIFDPQSKLVLCSLAVILILAVLVVLLTLSILRLRRAEDALLEREAKLMSIFRTAPVGIGMTANRVIKEVNDAMCRITGYSQEELFDQDSRMVYASQEDYEYVGREKYRQIAEHGTGTVETRWKHKDGSIREIVMSFTPLDAEDHSKGLIFTVLDITKRKQDEEALRKSRSLLDEAQRLTHLGSWEITAETEEIICSDEIFRIFGLNPGEIQPTVQDLFDRVHPEDMRRVSEHYRKTLEAGSFKTYDYRIVTKDGSVRWVHAIGSVACNDSGKAVKVVGTLQDTTEQRQVEEALRENEERLRLALIAANQGLFDSNLKTGEVMVSPEYASMLGYDPAFFKESKARWLDNLHPDDRKSITESFEAYMRGETPLYATEFRQRSQSGEWKWILTRGKLVTRNADGTPLRMLGICMDITERKLAEERIRELNEALEDRVHERTVQLRATNKELEAFVYSVSHDLRAPLRAIDGFAQILEDEFAQTLDAEGRRVCSIIIKEAKRMARLIDDLLAFSRLSRAEMLTSSIDMKRLAESVFHQLTTQEERKRIEFRLGSLPPAVGDPNLMRQVWVNLLSNAVKFSSRRPRAVIEVEGKREGNENMYLVRDDGAGFDMQYAHELFGVFHRLHSEREFEGTGVGLAIVQRLIHRHGGRVWGQSEVNKGSTFYFCLPDRGDLS